MDFKRGKHTISRLAKLVKVPVSTVRYYERVGLLDPVSRSAGNYRLYSDESMRRLQFIRASQAIGFRLEDIRGLLGEDESGDPCCGDVQDLIKRRLKDINEQLKNLRHVKKVLNSTLKKCEKTNRKGCCHLLETLREEP